MWCHDAGRSQGHGNRKARAPVNSRRQLYRMIQEAREPVDDRKPQTEAAAAVLFGGSKLIKFTENISLLILRNPDPAVPDFDLEATAAVAAADHDPACGGITHGVGHQI